MTAEQTLKSCCENGEAWVVGTNWVEGKATNIYDAMTKYAAQESIEFAKWIKNKEIIGEIIVTEDWWYWPDGEGIGDTEKLHQLYLKSK